jgi:hypothetical protein
MDQHNWSGCSAWVVLRIRRMPRNETIVTLVDTAAALSIYFRQDPFAQTLFTVRGERWSQIERRLRYRLGGGGVFTETTISAPIDQHTLQISDTLSKGGETVRSTVTRIGPRGKLGWEARGGDGALLGTGDGFNGEGRASMPGRGEMGFKSEHSKTTHWHQSTEGGGVVDIEETQTDATYGSRTEQKWKGEDGNGKPTGSGKLTTYDGPSGGWSLKAENPTPDGGKVVTTANGDKQGGAAHTTVYDAAGNVVSEGDSVEIINPDGSSSLTSSSMDTAGNETFTSVIRDADGTVHTHTMVIDKNGNVVKDEASDSGEPAPPAPPPPSGDGDSDGNGDGDGEGGDDDGNDDGDGNGNGDGEEEAGASGDDEGDGMGGGRGPIIGNPGGPQYPGDILGRILHGLGVTGGGGGTDEWNEGRGPQVTAEQAARIIAAAHHAPPPGGGDTDGDGKGNGRLDIAIAVPVGEFEDWNDHPRPETIQRFTRWLQANVAAVSASSEALQGLSGMPAARLGPG